MKNGLFVGLVVLCLSSSPLVQGANQRPIVAVFDIQVKGIEIAKPLQDMLTELMAEELGIGGIYKVMPPSDVRKTLTEKTKESYKECFDESCQIELGRSLAANKLLTSSIKKLADKCHVTGALYDLKSQASDTTAKYVNSCEEAGLVESIQKVAAKLRSWDKGAIGTEDTAEKNTETFGIWPVKCLDAKKCLQKAKDFKLQGKTDLALLYAAIAANKSNQARRYVSAAKINSFLDYLSKEQISNLEKVEERLTRACEQEEDSACFVLGTTMVMTENFEQSKFAYGKSCDLGNLASCYNLGLAYEKGHGVEKNLTKAVDLFRKVCDEDFMAGCFVLGDAYSYGKGVEQNKQTAVALYRRACSGGFMAACTSLGKALQNGKGIEKNYAKACKLYDKACRGQHMLGCNSLGICYGMGLVKKRYGPQYKDFFEACKYFKRACDGEDKYGCYNLALAHFNGKGVNRNKDKARTFYKKACTLGHKKSCDKLKEL
jgi:TPR repeat protein